MAATARGSQLKTMRLKTGLADRTQDTGHDNAVPVSPLRLLITHPAHTHPHPHPHPHLLPHPFVRLTWGEGLAGEARHSHIAYRDA